MVWLWKCKPTKKTFTHLWHFYISQTGPRKCTCTCPSLRWWYWVLRWHGQPYLANAWRLQEFSQLTLEILSHFKQPDIKPDGGGACSESTGCPLQTLCRGLYCPLIADDPDRYQQRRHQGVQIAFGRPGFTPPRARIAQLRQTIIGAHYSVICRLNMVIN